MCTKKLMGSTESPSTIVDPPALISFKNICSCCMLVKIQKLLFDHLLQSSVVLFFYKKKFKRIKLNFIKVRWNVERINDAKMKEEKNENMKEITYE